MGKDGGRLPFASAAGLVFVACLALAAAVSSGVLSSTFAFASFLLVGVVVSWWSPPATAAALGLLTIVFANGFAVNTGGTLTWHGESDVVRLICFLALSVTASILGHRDVDQTRPFRAAARRVEHG